MSKATAEHARAGTDAGFGDAKASAVQHARIGGQCGSLSLLLAGLGLIAWIISLFGQRRNRIVVPVVLLIIYITTYLLMV